MPADPEYSVEKLRDFLYQLPKEERTVCFYGGEPLMNIDRMTTIMNEVDARFVLQSNVTRLPLLSTNYLKKFSAILASVDGRPQVVDPKRGKGVYNKVINSVRDAISRGYKGTMIARMTVHKESDIFEEVTHLLSLGVFDYAHWQLNVQWDGPYEDSWPTFVDWMNEIYNPGISKLLEYFMDSMRNGVVLGIVPFIGVIATLLFNRDYSNKMQCGVGHHSFSIGTKGNILGCPVSWDDEWNMLGDMNQEPKDLKERICLQEPCLSCEELPICSGRCMYANQMKFWDDKGFEDVCGTVKHLINECRRYLPEIKGLIEQGVITEEPFLYDIMDDSMEVIP
eukprot:TRINITY_DN925_c0_g1_i1.p1 TRINITY_DN925_c0_g1~~TRINITY_DN925_c0_g1_i1.p1  ORF type:complete len:373 (+),score=98.72 TRINITY_DN925_c0_g1_i1:106-1119(+)